MSAHITIDTLRALCMKAAKRAGASPAAARSLSDATVAAEACGQKSVGVAHFFDYLESIREGRIDPVAVPELSRPKPAMIHCDAKGGLAQTGFDKAIPIFVKAAKKYGLALFSQSNAYTCGSLGYYAERLAGVGLISLAATNGPALIAGGGAVMPVYCTNPIAFAAPVFNGPPLLIDQSSSATAFVNVRAAAASGEPIPDGWAIDRDGKPTTDPKAAMEGALLAFGGARGANIALMVEVLSAGISGANWSLDAPSVFEGSANSGTGLFVLAIDPDAIAPDFAERLSTQLVRLSGEYGVHIPGRTKADAYQHAIEKGIVLDLHLLRRLKQAARR